MSKSRKYLIGLILLLLAGFSVAFILKEKPGKIVFIDLNKVVSEFKLTKELEAKLTVTTQARQNIMDSLKLDLEMISRQLNLDQNNKNLQTEFIAKRNDYVSKSDAFTKDNEQQSQEYNQQVFKQINQYVDDFRKEKGYSIILGATGDGTVMSGEKDCEVTEAVIEYINEKHSGKK